VGINKKRKMELYTLLTLMLAIILGAFGSLYFKIGSKKLSKNLSELLKNTALIKGAVMYGISAILYVFSLKGNELSVIYPMVATGYIWVCLLSVKFLKEKMTKEKWLGIFLIIIGVSFIGLGSV